MSNTYYTRASSPDFWDMIPAVSIPGDGSAHTTTGANNGITVAPFYVPTATKSMRIIVASSSPADHTAFSHGTGHVQIFGTLDDQLLGVSNDTTPAEPARKHPVKAGHPHITGL